MRVLFDALKTLLGASDPKPQERVVNLAEYASTKAVAQKFSGMSQEDRLRMRRLIAQMRLISGATSEADVMADAIGLLEWYAALVSDGHELYIIEDGEPTKLKFVFQSAPR